MSELLTTIYQKKLPTFYKMMLKEITGSFKLQSMFKRPNSFDTKTKLSKWCEEILELTRDLFKKHEFPSKYFYLGKELSDFLTSKILKDNFNIVSPSLSPNNSS